MRRSIRLAAATTATLALAILGAGCSSDSANDEEGTLLWADDFDGPAGQLPAADRWHLDVGTDWGNGQLEWDSDRPENVALDGNGNLAIVARAEQYQGCAYTSGRLTTQGLFSQTHGRFEARIKLPVGQGLWPAFWLLGANVGTVGWPACGEIDIMEYRGQEPNVVHGSLHGPGYSGASPISARYDLPGRGFDAAFHIFTVEWAQGEITWLVDDQVYQRLTAADLPGSARWVFDHPFNIILNLAVGGGYVGAPNASTQFPQTMLVDWVRVYGTAG
jgi:beta-glucanase (GH16 family)